MYILYAIFGTAFSIVLLVIMDSLLCYIED